MNYSDLYRLVKRVFPRFSIGYQEGEKEGKEGERGEKEKRKREKERRKRKKRKRVKKGEKELFF